MRREMGSWEPGDFVPATRAARHAKTIKPGREPKIEEKLPGLAPVAEDRVDPAASPLLIKDHFNPVAGKAIQSVARSLLEMDVPQILRIEPAGGQSRLEFGAGQGEKPVDRLAAALPVSGLVRVAPLRRMAEPGERPGGNVGPRAQHVDLLGNGDRGGHRFGRQGAPRQGMGQGWIALRRGLSFTIEGTEEPRGNGAVARGGLTPAGVWQSWDAQIF
jgi:hypothetical protein